MYTRDVSGGGATEAELINRYGKRPWFLKEPNAAPPYAAFEISAKDSRGRGYNFPNTEPSEVHVRLPKAKARRTENRPAELPAVGEVVELAEGGGEFRVVSVDLGGRVHPNTAILSVEWIE